MRRHAEATSGHAGAQLVLQDGYLSRLLDLYNPNNTRRFSNRAIGPSRNLAHSSLARKLSQILCSGRLDKEERPGPLVAASVSFLKGESVAF